MVAIIGVSKHGSYGKKTMAEKFTSNVQPLKLLPCKTDSSPAGQTHLVTQVHMLHIWIRNTQANRHTNTHIYTLTLKHTYTQTHQRKQMTPPPPPTHTSHTHTHTHTHHTHTHTHRHTHTHTHTNMHTHPYTGGEDAQKALSK